MAEPVMMVLKVDLQCSCCYKKVKKVLSKFPQIRDQTYNEKQNTVTIKVVCCNPEKLRDQICRKGCGSIKSIEIKPPVKKKDLEQKEGKEDGKKPGKLRTPPEKTEPKPTTFPKTGSPVPGGGCCGPCSEGRSGGPCFQGPGRPAEPGSCSCGCGGIDSPGPCSCGCGGIHRPGPCSCGCGGMGRPVPCSCGCGGMGRPGPSSCGCGGIDRPGPCSFDCGGIDRPGPCSCGCGGKGRPVPCSCGCGGIDRPGPCSCGCGGMGRPGPCSCGCGGMEGPIYDSYGGGRGHYVCHRDYVFQENPSGCGVM